MWPRAILKLPYFSEADIHSYIADTIQDICSFYKFKSISCIHEVSLIGLRPDFFVILNGKIIHFKPFFLLLFSDGIPIGVIEAKVPDAQTPQFAEDLVAPKFLHYSIFLFKF